MTSVVQCEVCGTAINPGPLGDVCPVCLLREGHPDFVRPDVTTASGVGTTAFQDRAGLPRMFGGYELLEEIAHGGMGMVYRARQQGLNREVAIKLLLSGAFASADFVRRFRREAAAAASLRHPNIVGVYEVGEVDGQPFLAMEFVAGRTLAQMVQERPLAPGDAARYVSTVARAVRHAHDNGLLHRDLKPSNVLIDGDDQPRVTDFGLAKQMDGSTDLTVTGQMLGSPNYLSPEAALGHESRLSPASDVYSLGATLYHLLTGRPPLLAGSLAETLVRVSEEAPLAPRLLNPALPRDLETICLKCLEKEPVRRYATASDLADDLERWLRGEPVRARPPSPAGRIWKWALRRPAQATLAAVATFAVAALVGASLWFNVHLTSARDESEKNRRLSETNRLAAEAGAAASWAQVIRMQVLTGNRLIAEGDPSAAALWFARALAAETESGGNEAGELQHRRRLAAAWQSVPRLVGRPMADEPARTENFEVDAELVLNGGIRGETAADAGLKLFRADGTPIRFFDPRAPDIGSDILPGSLNPRVVSINKTATAVLVYSRDESQRVWDLTTGRPLSRPLPGDGFGVIPRFSPDGRTWVRVRHESGRWYVESRPTMEPAAEPTVISVDSHLFDFRFDPGGRRLATAHWDGTVRLWAADTLKPDGITLHHANGINHIAFSPDGSRLATGGWGNEIKVWSVPEGVEVVPALNRGFPVRSFLFSHDGRFLAIQGVESATWIWDLFVDGPSMLEATAFPAQTLASNGRGVVAAWDSAGRVHFWNGAASEISHWSAKTAVPGSLSSAALSADGQYAAAAYLDGSYGLWSVRSGDLLHRGKAGALLNLAVVFSPDGHCFATASQDGFVRRFRTTDGAEIQPALNHGGEANQAAFSPDGSRLATCGDNREVKIWNISDAALVGTIRHESTVLRIAYNPSGTRLLTAMADGSSDALSARLWDAVTFAPVGAAMEHMDGVIYANFFADGTRILTAGEDGQARVWDASDGHPLTPWMRCGRRIFFVQPSPDGLVIATIDESRALRLWDAITGELLSLLPDSESSQMAFTGTDRIIFGGGGAPVRTMTLPVAKGPPEEVIAWSRFVAGRDLDSTGGLVPLSPESHGSLFTRFKAMYPERFVIETFSPAWHRHELVRSVRNGNAFAEKFHRQMLDRVRVATGPGGN